MKIKTLKNKDIGIFTMAVLKDVFHYIDAIINDENNKPNFILFSSSPGYFLELFPIPFLDKCNLFTLNNDRVVKWIKPHKLIYRHFVFDENEIKNNNMKFFHVILDFDQYIDSTSRFNKLPDVSGAIVVQENPFYKYINKQSKFSSKIRDVKKHFKHHLPHLKIIKNIGIGHPIFFFKFILNSLMNILNLSRLMIKEWTFFSETVKTLRYAPFSRYILMILSEKIKTTTLSNFLG
ncbi:MAG: hypothetical protein ACTSVI_10470 [Promethearchaeota archaeon]